MSFEIARIFTDVVLLEPVRIQAMEALSPLIGAVGEVGYEAFLKHREQPGREGAPLPPMAGSPLVNVIPGTAGAACAPVLVALTRGRKGPMGFDSIMQEVKTHLIRCSRITRLVLVFSDQWDGASFRKLHRAELHAHHGNGVRFRFVMAGDPDRLLVQVPIDLG